MYGASYKKLKSMLGLSDSEAKALYDAYWEAVKPLSDLREEVGKVWKRRGSKYVVALMVVRSTHALSIHYLTLCFKVVVLLMLSTQQYSYLSG